MNPYIKSNERGVILNKNQETVKQPLGIDYNALLNSIGKVNEKQPIEKKSSKIVKDLRKTSNNEGIAKELGKDDAINNLEQSSIIPVPGLAVEYERDGSQERPPDSDWIAPHGPQWGPMTR